MLQAIAKFIPLSLQHTQGVPYGKMAGFTILFDEKQAEIIPIEKLQQHFFIHLIRVMPA